MAEAERDQRLTHRVDNLYATDPQFRAAAPLQEVTDAAHGAGLRLWEVVEEYLNGYADRPALGQRAREVTRDETTGRRTTTLLSGFDTITYGRLRDRVTALASVWQSSLPGGFHPGDFVAVLGFTSIGYAMINLACIRLGAVFVPLQTSSTAGQLAPIVAETQPRIFAASIESLDVAVDVVLGASSVERLVVFDYLSDDDEQRERYQSATARLAAAGRTLDVVPLLEDLDAGAGLPEAPPFVPPVGEDPLATLIYTSGSTGTPKGAMYTTDLVARLWLRPHGPSQDIGIQIPAIHLQYMPLSHVYGLAWLIATLSNGGVGYFAAKSDMSTLVGDIGLVRPTALSLVPRVCDMIYRRYRKELDQPPADGQSPDELDDAVKSELRQDFIGGRVVSAMCGSAPLSKQMHAFMESLLDCPVSDGYGSTENGGGIMRSGKILRPPVTDYKLVDVPELGYFTTDKPHPRGELYMKSTSLIPGYYKHPELSAEIFDEDGFYKTGDIMAEIAPDHLVYLDRSNNVIKLSQGEFVAVSKLEADYSAGPYIRQIFVYGSSEQPFLLAVVVPNADAIGDGDAHALVAKSLQQIAAENRLNAHEIPRAFLIESEPFTRANGLLSGVGKLLRPALKARYGERLDAMYADIAAGQENQIDQLRAAARELPTVDTVRRAAIATLGLEAAGAGLPADAQFIELGGDSLSAFSFGSLLEQIYHIDVPVQTIVSPTATLATIADYIDGERISASTRPTFASVHGRDAAAVRAADLTLDKFIDADTLAAAPTLTGPTGTVNTVLLTGANGYLGRFLCLEWLQRLAQVDGTLICLARGADPIAARQRIEAAIDSGDGELSARFRALADRHLEVLVGDVGAANLGVDVPTWNRLAQGVDLIVHVAALVNHVLPYSQLFGPNDHATERRAGGGRIGGVPTRTGNRTGLARFLRSRREALTPAQVGLPAGVRRRTPGLRRDEVAELASMSTNYYEKLEQARGPRPSPTVLDAIAGGLRLSVEEREHLYLLADQPLPAQGGRRGELDAGLVITMESLTATTIAMIVDDLGTVLAQNRLSVEVFGRLVDQADHADNMVWRWFTDRAWRESWAPTDTHDATAAGFVADLRALAAQRGDDPATACFIDELRAASDEFAQNWDRHDVHRMQPGYEVLRHPQVGRLTLECAVLHGRAPGQRLFLFHPAAGTPTGDRLAALASRSEADVTGSS